MRLLSFALLAGLSAAAAAQPSTVILVRHAEKASQTESDPILSEAGVQRARALAGALTDARISSIITTQFQRTRLTAADVIEATKLTPIVVPTAGGTPAHVAAVAAAVKARPAGEIVLVVGHSNTIPAIVTALGGPKLTDFCDSQYSTMFVVELTANPPRVIRAHFGAADPVDPACQNLMIRKP